MSGAEVKKLILDANVHIWKVAYAWGISDSNFSKRLRKDFSDAEVNRIKEIIAEIKKQ